MNRDERTNQRAATKADAIEIIALAPDEMPGDVSLRFDAWPPYHAPSMPVIEMVAIPADEWEERRPGWSGELFAASARAGELLGNSHEYGKPLLELGELRVDQVSEHNFYSGFVHDIVHGGLFIATYAPADIGQTVAFELRLPMSVAAEPVVGEVEWVRELGASRDAQPGMGVCLRGLRPAVAEAIDEFMRRRDPIFFDDDHADQARLRAVVAERVLPSPQWHRQQLTRPQPT